MSKVIIQNQNGQVIPMTVVYNQNGGGTIQFWKGTDTEYRNLVENNSSKLNELIAANTVFFIEEEDRT